MRLTRKHSPGLGGTVIVVAGALLLGGCGRKEAISASAQPKSIPADAAEVNAAYDAALKRTSGLLGEQKLSEALASAQAAAALNPFRYEAHALAALILYAAGEKQAAQDALTEARRRAPAKALPRLERLATTLAGKKSDLRPAAK